MAPQELQVLADASEADARERYQRMQDFGAVVEDAVRRADAMVRLELQLSLMRFGREGATDGGGELE
jgi:hypothetical protein